VVNLRLALKEAYTGATFNLHFDGSKACPHCLGKGTDRPEDFARCPHCGGEGIVNQRVQHFGMVQIIQQHCGHCQGKGVVKKSVCRKCRGRIL
jgi:DnaJ-class molecular chaperone